MSARGLRTVALSKIGMRCKYICVHTISKVTYFKLLVIKAYLQLNEHTVSFIY